MLATLYVCSFVVLEYIGVLVHVRLMLYCRGTILHGHDAREVCELQTQY